MGVPLCAPLLAEPMPRFVERGAHGGTPLQGPDYGLLTTDY